MDADHPLQYRGGRDPIRVVDADDVLVLQERLYMYLVPLRTC